MFKTDNIILAKRRNTTSEEESDSSQQGSNLIVEWPLSSCEDSSSSARPPVVAHTPLDTINERRRAVIFSHATKVFFLDIDEADKTEKWYSSSDYTAFKASISGTVCSVRRAMASGRSISSIKRCIRGIEFACTDEGIKQREKSTRSVINAVLDEQERQRAHGISHVYRIAAASSTTSDMARSDAYGAGIADASVAYKIHHGKRQDTGQKDSHKNPLNLINEALATMKLSHPKAASVQYSIDRQGLHTNSFPNRPNSFTDTDMIRTSSLPDRTLQPTLMFSGSQLQKTTDTTANTKKNVSDKRTIGNESGVHSSKTKALSEIRSVTNMDLPMDEWAMPHRTSIEDII